MPEAKIVIKTNKYSKIVFFFSTIYKILSKTKISYLSSHPMVGSEKSGVQNNQPDMYKDNIIFLISIKSFSEITKGFSIHVGNDNPIVFFKNSKCV